MLLDKFKKVSSKYILHNKTNSSCSDSKHENINENN